MNDFSKWISLIKPGRTNTSVLGPSQPVQMMQYMFRLLATRMVSISDPRISDIDLSAQANSDHTLLVYKLVVLAANMATDIV